MSGLNVTIPPLFEAHNKKLPSVLKVQSEFEELIKSMNTLHRLESFIHKLHNKLQGKLEDSKEFKIISQVLFLTHLCHPDTILLEDIFGIIHQMEIYFCGRIRKEEEDSSSSSSFESSSSSSSDTSEGESSDTD